MYIRTSRGLCEVFFKRNRSAVLGAELTMNDFPFELNKQRDLHTHTHIYIYSYTYVLEVYVIHKAEEDYEDPYHNQAKYVPNKKTKTKTKTKKVKQQKLPKIVFRYFLRG